MSTNMSFPGVVVGSAVGASVGVTAGACVGEGGASVGRAQPLSASTRLAVTTKSMGKPEKGLFNMG
jgi:hypothetical protein